MNGYSSFEEYLYQETNKFDTKKNSKSEKKEKARERKPTPILSKPYTDDIERYRTTAYMTRITDMNIFKR